MLAMWREVRRPLDHVDAWCSRVDADLDAGPVREKPLLVALDDVSFEWPHPWTPEEVADSAYRLGFAGGRSAERMDRRLS